jgi:splicing factor U2AF subunit
MVTAEELVDEQDYQDILEDIREECEKYGAVDGLRIPRPGKRSFDLLQTSPR